MAFKQQILISTYVEGHMLAEYGTQVHTHAQWLGLSAIEGGSHSVLGRAPESELLARFNPVTFGPRGDVCEMLAKDPGANSGIVPASFRQAPRGSVAWSYN